MIIWKGLWNITPTEERSETCQLVFTVGSKFPPRRSLEREQMGEKLNQNSRPGVGRQAIRSPSPEQKPSYRCDRTEWFSIRFVKVFFIIHSMTISIIGRRETNWPIGVGMRCQVLLKY